MNTTNATPAAAVVVGASAGAVDALSAIFPALPRGYSLPIFVVVHLPEDRRSFLPQLFQMKCNMEVHEAEDKEPIVAGTIYIAPPDYHLLVETDFHLSLSNEEPVRYSRPSIDVLFESAADAYGPRLIGIVLTGANNDGAMGLRAVKHGGGMALVQRPDQAQSSTMPQAALDACPEALPMSLKEIASFLLEVVDSE